MGGVRRLLKWIAALWLLGEFWTRGGRELLLGDGDEPGWGVNDHLSTWVDVPGVTGDPTGRKIRDDAGREIGEVIGFTSDDVTHVGVGQPKTVPRVHVKVERGYLGWPINVAVAQAEKFARQTLTPQT